MGSTVTMYPGNPRRSKTIEIHRECSSTDQTQICLPLQLIVDTVGETIKNCASAMRLLDNIHWCAVVHAECLIAKISKCPQSVHRDHNEGPARVYVLAFSLENRPLGTNFSKSGDGTTDMIDCCTSAFIYDANVMHRGCASATERYDRIFLTFASARDEKLPRISRSCLFTLKSKYPTLDGRVISRKIEKGASKG